MTSLKQRPSNVAILYIYKYNINDKLVQLYVYFLLFWMNVERRCPHVIEYTEHLSLPLVISARGVCFAQSLVYCVMFCPFSFGHCVVWPLIYGIWLSLWYLFLWNVWQVKSRNLNWGKYITNFLTKCMC